jgi:DNA helicase-2/ATP-dependent DNA helicase PcrA
MYIKPKVTPQNKEKIRKIKDIVREVEKNVISSYDDVDYNPHTKIDYRCELNQRQFMAAVTTEGPVLVIAGAGTGKTRTVSYRVAYLIENKVQPENILMLTFTRKAAEEMLDRIGGLIGQGRARKVESGTFHGFASKMLRSHASVAGLTSRFIILDPSDAKDMIDLIISSEIVPLTQAEEKALKANIIVDIVSKAKNWDVSVADAVSSNFKELLDYKDKIVRLAEEYRKKKIAGNKLDYDDILVLFRNLLRKSDSFRDILQERFKYVMVDEFQDTNIVQKQIIDLLVDPKTKNVMVVGDDAQSIYRFRGATMENILTFQETYNTCKVIKLEQNYRSVQEILAFTNPIIDHAVIGYKKSLISSRKGDMIPEVKRFSTKEVEAQQIVKYIKQGVAKGTPLNEMAVIFRSAFHSQQLQVELTRAHIPFVVYGGQKFTERQHVKDFICYVRVAVNDTDDVSWHRILKSISGVGNIAASKVSQNIVAKSDLSFEDFKGHRFHKDLKRLGETITRVQRKDLRNADKAKMIKNFYESIHEDIEDYRVTDLELLCKIASEYKTLESFLNDFALDPPNKQKDKGKTPIEDESDLPEPNLVLTTVHSSKGLEWDNVFIINTLDGMFPSYRSFSDFEDLEEERRLFYVACTRARNQLIMTMPDYGGTGKNIFREKSRFIDEVNERSYNYKEFLDTKRNFYK